MNAQNTAGASPLSTKTTLSGFIGMVINPDGTVSRLEVPEAEISGTRPSPSRRMEVELYRLGNLD